MHNTPAPATSRAPAPTPALRILIIGAGIAGATLATMLRHAGLDPLVIERAAEEARERHVVTLTAPAMQVLDSLDAGQALHRQAHRILHHVLFDRRGAKLVTDTLPGDAPWLNVDSVDLVRALRAGAGDIRYQTTLRSMTEHADGITVRLSRGVQIEVDLIVAADGMTSDHRARLMSRDQLMPFATGWGGYVLWAPLPRDAREAGFAVTHGEVWGNGWGLRSQPLAGQVGLFLAGPEKLLLGGDPAAHAARVLAALPPGPLAEALSGALDRPGPTALARYWRIADSGAREWAQGRNLLIGDAATGFAPGTLRGATAAIEVAAALAQSLATLPRDADVPAALHAFEAATRPRILAAQAAARRRERLMTWGPPRLWLRDRLIRRDPSRAALSGAPPET